MLVTGMARRWIFLALGLAAARVALGDDATDRALLERAQRENAFSLGVQQSIESGQAGKLGPRERLELETRQREQREKQDALFYQQKMQTYAPASDLERRTEEMRAKQEREDQLSRFRFESASPPKGPVPTPAPGPVAPSIGTAPVSRVPVTPSAVAAMPSPHPAPAEPLAMIRRVEHDADLLWRSALAGDWGAAQRALGDLRDGVDALRGERFKSLYAESGGRAQALAAVLARLDSTVSGAETQLGARDADALMHSANTLTLTAAELVPEMSPARSERDPVRPLRAPPPGRSHAGSRAAR
jgi:hypothetical protein